MGDSRRLHHNTPSTSCEGQTVHWEYRSVGPGGQGAGQGKSLLLLLFPKLLQLILPVQAYWNRSFSWSPGHSLGHDYRQKFQPYSLCAKYCEMLQKIMQFDYVSDISVIWHCSICKILCNSSIPVRKPCSWTHRKPYNIRCANISSLLLTAPNYKRSLGR